MEKREICHEMAGTFAIVGCENNPNFQVWGARSDLKCKRKRKDKIIKMSFKDWMGDEQKKGSNGR